MKVKLMPVILWHDAPKGLFPIRIFSLYGFGVIDHFWSGQFHLCCLRSGKWD